MTNINNADVMLTITYCGNALKDESFIRMNEDAIDFVDSIGQILQWMASIISYEIIGKEHGDRLLDPSESVRGSITTLKPYIPFPASVLSYAAPW